MSDHRAFELTAADKHSGLWLRLAEHLQARLDFARRRNDSDLSEHETQALRGEIKTLKALLRLGDDRPITG